MKKIIIIDDPEGRWHFCGENYEIKALFFEKLGDDVKNYKLLEHKLFPYKGKGIKHEFTVEV